MVLGCTQRRSQSRSQRQHEDFQESDREHRSVHVRRVSRLVSDAEQDQQMPRNGSMRRGICAQTRRGRRDGSRPLLAQSGKGILELHEAGALSGADGVWVGS